MSHHEKTTAKMGPPSVKSSGANATADSPAASADISPLESAMIESVLSKSAPPSPSKSFDSEEERGAWFKKVLEDMKNNTPEENAAIVRKYGPRIVGESIPYDTDAGIEYDRGERR